MKRKILRYLLPFLAICTMLIFVLCPFMCTDLHLKLYFKQDTDFSNCQLYYTTSAMPDFNDANCIAATMSPYKADIRIPKELCGKLENIRLDFDNPDGLIAISHIELCSGGFIQKSMDAADFFADPNVILSNDIAIIQNTLDSTYIDTDGLDPYLILHPTITAMCNNAFSHYTLTKLLICLFLGGTFLLARKNFFPTE